MYHKILVAMALDHGVSPQTLAIARALRAPGGEIIALHVLEEPPGSSNAELWEALQEEIHDRARDLMKAKMVGVNDATAKLVRGHIHTTIVEYAEKNGIDCIVMGSHKPGLTDYLIGSTAARVVRHAPCAVHVHRTS
ncbi:Universal stress protein F [Defluviimonas aquaemixtae]|uniref:Universal stress protein F n=1 Tax=Albidovulum aquaemixtae TaxID=1542388 RepID=A0A2R8B837_9RHOB|nr:universal stress protein [Defluviimonas aquaemixtae]SPH18815.1 Universal stress protein F [Defluviimonas aquaemixtae]